MLVVSLGVSVLKVKPCEIIQNEDLSSLRHLGSPPTGDRVQMQQELAHDRRNGDIAWFPRLRSQS